MAAGSEVERLRRENAELRRQVAEAADALRAIRSGEVDALVVRGLEGTRLYTLESAYEPYRAFVEQMQQGAASLTPDGLILYSNARFAQILGVAGDRMLGTSIYGLVDEAHHAMVRWLLAATPGCPADGEMVLQGADGALVHALFSVTAMPDGIRCAVVTDVTDRIREQELLASREWLHVTLASIGDAIVSCDAAGRITFLNAVAETLTGWTQAEALGQPIEHVFRIVEEGSPRPLEDLVHRVLRDGQAGQLGNRAMLVARDGREVPIDDSAAPIRDKAGRVAGAVLVFQDATDRRRAQQALTESDRRKDEFIAVLSHELRNPLAPIRYALPVLQAQSLDDAGSRAVAVIGRQVDHLTRLVDDLLDVSRITRGKIELRREHVTVGSAVTAAAEAASPAIVTARHRLRIVVPEEPIWLFADAARISQVITNLLTNSAKYTPRGGEITVSAERDGGHAVIRVVDNGIGIPHEALPTIFNMFTQVTGADRAQGGLGIGLALVHQLVEMHGGTVEARSAGPGQGAELIVRLPVAHDVRAAKPGEGEPRQAHGARLRVLVVDDNADLVDMLALAVESAGHEVRKALDGPSAVSAALSYRPQVVLLDLGLPVMSGIEVARELKRHPETAAARLVALTGWGQAEDHRMTREAGFEHHLTKPTEPRSLQHLLARIAAGGES
jgi:PAS domain S-box-containing protein